LNKTTFDGLALTLRNSGKVASNAKTKGSSCLTLNRYHTDLDRLHMECHS